MFGLILSLILGALVAIALAATRTMPRADHPVGWRNRSWRLVLGVVAYPAATALVLHGLSGSAIDAASITVFALPGLAFGALVRRIWMVGVPPIGAAIWLLIAYALDPNCTTTCGSDDTWTILALTTMLYLVIPAVFALLVGTLAGNLLSRLTSGRAARGRHAAAKPSATPDVTHGV